MTDKTVQAMPELPVVAHLVTNDCGDSWVQKHPGAYPSNDAPLCKVSDAITYAESLRVELEAARAALTAICKGAPTEEPERYEGDNHGDTAEYTLRAMARNYASGNLWDKLDTETVLFAADEIKMLRAALESFAATHAKPDTKDAERPIDQLIAAHAQLIEDGNNYAYFELAYARQTGWMAWLTDKPLCGPVVNPDRKVIAAGQGDTPDEAARAAIASTKPEGKP